jgi:hypothetical protein
LEKMKRHSLGDFTDGLLVPSPSLTDTALAPLLKRLAARHGGIGRKRNGSKEKAQDVSCVEAGKTKVSPKRHSTMVEPKC